MAFRIADCGMRMGFPPLLPPGEDGKGTLCNPKSGFRNPKWKG